MAEKNLYLKFYSVTDEGDVCLTNTFPATIEDGDCPRIMYKTPGSSKPLVFDYHNLDMVVSRGTFYCCLSEDPGLITTEAMKAAIAFLPQYKKSLLNKKPATVRHTKHYQI